MSESEHRKQQSEVCNDGNGDEDDDNDEEDEEGDRRAGGEGASGESKVEEERRREVSGKGVFGISRGFRNAIKRSFRRKKKRRKQKEKEKERGDGVIRRLPSSSSSAGRGGGGDVGCYLCFLQPRIDEGPETPTSDPNSDGFSYEMLRTLIEKNDFYRKECNPHTFD